MDKLTFLNNKKFSTFAFLKYRIFTYYATNGKGL